MAFWSSIDHMTTVPAYLPTDLQPEQAELDISETIHLGSANMRRPSTANRDSDQPASSGPNRRLACDPCRDRKVRCDRQQPVCGRCARLRHECSYSSPSKQTAAKMDLSRLLLTLHSRLSQAETQIARNRSSILNINSFDATWSDMGLATAMAVTAATETTTPELSTTSPNHQQPPFPLTALGMSMEAGSDVNMAETMMLDSITDWPNTTPPNGSSGSIIAEDVSAQTNAPAVISNLETTQSSRTPSPRGSTPSECRSHATSAISAGLVSTLHGKYFDVFGPILPIINQSRFYSEVVQCSGSVATLALSYAVAALGALAASDVEFNFAQEHCYNQARELLDVCERQESDGILSNINILQTCVLLTFFEFKRPNFARSWMTLGRAIRLCKMMGLDWIDDHENGSQNAGMRIQLAPATSPAELEERRRTFWLLYTFDIFAAIKLETSTTFDSIQMPVSIPCPGDLSSITEVSTMPSLPDIDTLSGVANLSSFAGTIITVSLLRRCFDHVRATLTHGISYSFWDAHYQLDRAIRDGHEKLAPQQLSTTQNTDVLSLMLQTKLAAVEIWLHETALAKVEQERLSEALAIEATTRCQAAAYKVVEAIKQGRTLPSLELNSFKQSSDFFVWPITMAIKALRMLDHKDSQLVTITHSDALLILSDTMREIVPPELIPAGLLEDMENSHGAEDGPEGRLRASSF